MPDADGILTAEQVQEITCKPVGEWTTAECLELASTLERLREQRDRFHEDAVTALDNHKADKEQLAQAKAALEQQ